MVRLVITADCHLREDQPERESVLRWICQWGGEQEADALLIGGDLFDSERQALKNQQSVQRLFEEELPPRCPVLVVAGNHDENLQRLGWGERVQVLAPFEHRTVEGTGGRLRVHGLPYRRGTALGSDVQSFDCAPDVPNLLLGHATYLDEEYPQIPERIHAQNEDNAFLVHRKDLAGQPFDHVLLGHWHGTRTMREDPPVTSIGAPVPNSRREQGPRSILVATWDGSRLNLTPHPVESPPGWYYEQRDQWLVPGYEEEALEELEASFPEPDRGCEVWVRMHGFTPEAPEQFRRRLNGWVDRRRPKYRDIHCEINLHEAPEFDRPIVRRLLEQLAPERLSELLAPADLVEERDPDLVLDHLRDLFEQTPDRLARRAQRLLLESLYEQMHS